MSLRDRAGRATYRALHAVAGPLRGVRVIPMYHSVGQEMENSARADMFERQVAVLVERFAVARLSDLAEVMQTSPPDRNIACLTFDDGLRDNHEIVLPLLERFGVKGTFFVTSGFLGQTFPASAGPCPMMTAAQVRELSSLGHEVGAHTVSHPKLTRLPSEGARAEVEGSKRALEDLIGREVASFAYPKGDHDARVVEVVRAAGFRWAVTTQSRLVERTPDWLVLPRVWIAREDGVAEFRAKTSRAVEWYARLR